MTDPAVIIALGTAFLALIGTMFVGVSSILVTALGFWNQQRIAKQTHDWDMQERARNLTKTLVAVDIATEGAKEAVKAANDTNHKLEATNLRVEDLHHDIKAVLDVAIASGTGPSQAAQRDSAP